MGDLSVLFHLFVLTGIYISVDSWVYFILYLVIVPHLFFPLPNCSRLGILELFPVVFRNPSTYSHCCACLSFLSTLFFPPTWTQAHFVYFSVSVRERTLIFQPHCRSKKLYFANVYVWVKRMAQMVVV